MAEMEKVKRKKKGYFRTHFKKLGGTRRI